MLTINDYMNGRAVSGTLHIARQDVLATVAGKFRNLKSDIRFLYIKHTDNRIEVGIQTPSETSLGVRYETIFVIYLDESGKLSGKSKFTVYSNEPAFWFDSMYLLAKLGSLNKDAQKLFSRALKRPKKRKPSMQLGLDKHVGMAIMFIQQNKDYLVKTTKLKAVLPIRRIPSVDSKIEKISKSNKIRKITSFKL